VARARPLRVTVLLRAGRYADIAASSASVRPAGTWRFSRDQLPE
jgi:hypothetical protein